MRAALRPLPELVESVLADFKTAAALQHRQAACLLRWDDAHMEALQENLPTHDLMGALQIQVHFCFTKPVEQSLLSRLTEAMLWIRHSQQRYSDIADLGLQFSVSVVDLVEYLWNWGKAPHLAPRAMLSADLKKCWILGAFRVGCFTKKFFEVRSFVEVPLNFVLVQVCSLWIFTASFLKLSSTAKHFWPFWWDLSGSRVPLWHSRGHHRPFSSANC